MSSDRSPAYEQFIVGPEDVLVLVTKTHMDPGLLAEMSLKVPRMAEGRVLLVDGEAFEARVVRGSSNTASQPPEESE